MTIIMPWWLPLAITAISGLIGWAIATIAYHWPEDTRPGPAPRVALPPLPRAGLFPTEPQSLWSEHQAQLQGTEREIRRMIDNAPPATLGYDPKQYWWEGPY